MEIIAGEQKRVSQTLQIEEGKELLGLCRSGRLYEVEAWIAAGGSLQVPAEFKKTPLQISVGLGFHSLVELLVIHETCQTVKNGALAKAVELRSVELVQLLLQHGAEITGVHFSDVLRTWEPNLIRLFLESGADVVTGLPFAIAFGEKVRTALRPFVDYKTAQGLQEALYSRAWSRILGEESRTETSCKDPESQTDHSPLTILCNNM